MSGYTKLFSSILTSTIWAEPPVVCKVWITMLALADPTGLVEGTIPGLARQAVLSNDEVRAALEVLSSPDPESRSKDHDGRRVLTVDGGWQLVNYEKYRFKLSAEDQRERWKNQKRRQRGEMSTLSTNVHQCPPSPTFSNKAEAEASTEAEGRKQKLAPDSIPEGLEPHQYALGILEQAGVVTDRHLVDACAQAIKITATNEARGHTWGDSAALLLARMKTAIDRGETVNRFWFQDGHFTGKAKDLKGSHDEQRRERNRQTLERAAAEVFGGDAG